MADNLKNLGKVCITPEGVWDVNKEYDRLALVVTTDDSTQRVLSYVSRQHVPAGQITLSNKDYWQLFATGLTMQDITVDENGNIKMGDTVIYQIPLGDALGEIVVDKIKEDLTNYIMTEIRSYMNGMVTELINSFSTQIGRLIDNGFEVRNKLSGEVNAKHSGTIDVNVNGGGESEDHEFIFTGDDLNINVESSGGYALTHVVSTKDGDLIGFSGGNRPSWIDLLEWSIAGTQYRVQIRCKANTSETTRTGTITLTQNESGNTLTITVTQSGSGSTPSDTFVFESNRTDVTNTAIAGNNAISLTSTKNGELIGFTTTNKPEWITVTSHENGTRHEVTLAFAANDSENDRTGTVVLTQSESGNTVTINVTQYGTEHIVTPTHMVDVTVINGVTQEQIPTARIYINNVEARNRTFDEGTDVSVRVNAEGYIARDIVERPITQQDPLVQSDYEYSETINDISQDAYITVKLYPEPDKYTFTANTEAEPNKTLNYGANVKIFSSTLTSTKNGSQIGYVITSQPDWVTSINTQQNGSISGNMTANESVNSRTGDIILTQNESGKIVQITIVQAGTGSGGGENSGGSGDSGGGESGDSDVYVFEANPSTLSLGAGTNLTSTVNVVSTKNGSSHPYMRNVDGNWFTATVSGNTVTITAQPNTTGASRNYRLILTQSDSNNILYIDITQAAFTPFPANSGIVAMISGDGNTTEQNLTDSVNFTSDRRYLSWAPTIKLDGGTTDPMTILSNNFASDATDTNTFVVNNGTNALAIQVFGDTPPSTAVTTPYEAFVSHGEYGGLYRFNLVYNPS